MLRYLSLTLVAMVALRVAGQNISDVKPSVGFFPDSSHIPHNTFLAQGHLFLPIDRPNSWHLGRIANKQRIESYCVSVTYKDSILYSKENVLGEELPSDLMECVRRARPIELKIDFYNIKAILNNKTRIKLPKGYVLFLMNGG